MYGVILQEELRTVGHSSEHRTRGPALPRSNPFTVIWSSVVYRAVAFWWCPTNRKSRLAIPSAEFLQAPYSLLVPLFSCYPKVLLVLHKVCEVSPAQVHHMLASWRIVNLELEFLSRGKQGDLKIPRNNTGQG